MSLYRDYRPQNFRILLVTMLIALSTIYCGKIPDQPLMTGPVAEVDSFGFSIVVDSSLVDAGWTIREFAYSPARFQQYRSVRFPIVFEMFIDRPSFNGHGFQPLHISGERVERGSYATRVVIRVFQRPAETQTFEAVIDTVRNLNQTVTDVVLNGQVGRELSTRLGNPNDPSIYAWSHTEEMVPRMVFEGGSFLYFVNTFESRGNNPDTTQVAGVLSSFRITP